MQKRLTAALLVCAAPSVLLAQIAVLQIKVLEGEGAVFAAGSRSLRPLLVQVTDETGRPVAAAAVTFHTPDGGPGGVFANGLRTDVAITDAAGRASLRSLQLNRTPGQFEIRILAVKEQARAGTVSRHYISDAADPRATARSTGPRAGSRRKWLALALIGAAGAGIAVAAAGGNAPPASAAAPGVTIGIPTITVAKP